MLAWVDMAGSPHGSGGTDRPPGSHATGDKAQATAGRDLLVSRAPGVGVRKEDQTQHAQLRPGSWAQGLITIWLVSGELRRGLRVPGCAVPR